MTATSKYPVNIGLLAHVDAGKTTLSEALLYTAGARRTLGRVDHGDSFLDTHELERNRGITIFSKQAQLSTDTLDITLVDTPGHPDFAAEAERVMPILDCAVLVISATDGVQAHTKTLWQLLQRYDVPVFLFINKMDLPDVSQESVLKQLQESLCADCLDFADPQLAENIAVYDEKILANYLESGQVADAAIQQLIAQRKVFPCCFGAALRLEGIDSLLALLDRYAPRKAYPGLFGAKVYKISRDPQGNRFTWLKLTGGSLQVRQPIGYRNLAGELLEEKVLQIRLYTGDKFTAAEALQPGQLAAVTGLSATWAGMGLGCEGDAQAPMSQAVMAYRVNLPKDTDPIPALQKLRQLEEEDPQLRIFWDDKLKHIHIQIMGKIQLEVLQNMIADRFSMDVTLDSGHVFYKETIAAPVVGIGHFEPLRHYAEVQLLLEPLPPGSGIVTDSVCSTDILDRSFQKLVMTHLSEKAHLGVLTGAPITDIKITLLVGRAHVKHTEGGDFRQATYRAIRQGLMQAQSVLLEPWYAFTLTVPTPVIGRAITDIRSMSGEFDAPQSEGDYSTLTGILPAAEVKDYADQLASYTQGLGRFHVTFHGYAPCHNADTVIEKTGYDPEADLENTPDSVFCDHGAGVTVKWDKVKDFCHLDCGLKPEGQEAPTLITGNLRMDDKELEAIMLREFGPIKRPQYQSAANRPATEKLTIRPPRQTALIVDGYNIIFAWDDLASLAREDLDAARRQLCDWLSSYASFRKCWLVVVFDGYKVKGNPGEKLTQNNIQIVYTKENETGDAYIESLVDQIGHNYDVKVATSDSLVQLGALRSGVLRMSARELRGELERTQQQMRQHYQK